MSDEDAYGETGGLRWGASYLRAAHASWPFATLRVDRDGMEMKVRFPFFGRHFAFARQDIVALRFRRLAGTGLQVEHNRSDLPQHVSFWTSSRSRLAAALERFGYSVEESSTG